MNDHATIEEVIGQLAHIVEIKVRDRDTGYVPDYAPDSSDYTHGTEPGCEWDLECGARLAEVADALPDGWLASWDENDLIVERIGQVCKHCGADLSTSLARHRALYPGDADPAPYCDDDCAAAAEVWAVRRERIGGAL